MLFTILSILSRSLFLLAAFLLYQKSGEETSEVYAFYELVADKGMTEDEIRLFRKPNLSLLYTASAIVCVGLAISPVRSPLAKADVG